MGHNLSADKDKDRGLSGEGETLCIPMEKPQTWKSESRRRL